jgi:S-(hydroxymethyl)glutathione dehydrogenase / alcohol dehydrogenase
MTITTRAAVLTECPGQLELVAIDIDSPARGEVQVRTYAAGLCHSDLHFMQGKYRPPLPIVLGHEVAGIVEEVGPGVTYLQPGDHVAGCLSVFCGECEFCVTGRPHLCGSSQTRRPPDATPRLRLDGEAVQQGGQLGGFAERVLVHEHALVKIDHAMPLDRAAVLGCAVMTGVGAVTHTARVPAGATVAVIGCGGVGLNVVQGAVLAGAARVIAIDQRASKLELARQFGATDTVDASQSEVVDAVRDLTAGGVEFAFEAVGLAATAEQAFSMLRRGGTATVIGLIPDGERVCLDASAFWMAEKKIQGSTLGSNRFRYDLPRLVDLYLQGRLNLDTLISARISLDQINAGFDALARGDVARSVVIYADQPKDQS